MVGQHLGLLVLYFVKQGGYRPCRMQLRSQRDRIDEKTNGIFDTGKFGGTSRDGHSEDDIFAACEPSQQAGPHGLNDGIYRETLLASKRFELRGLFRG